MAMAHVMAMVDGWQWQWRKAKAKGAHAQYLRCFSSSVPLPYIALCAVVLSVDVCCSTSVRIVYVLAFTSWS
jgi:hypothetical protein